MIYNKVLIHSIILAVSHFGLDTLTSKEVLMGSIKWLYEKYEQDNNEEYLYKAINHAYAFLEMGYDYKCGKDSFEPVVTALGMTMEDIFPAKKWKYKKLPLTKCNIRGLIGRWNPNLQSMKIDEVVNDIYDNIRYKRIGDYLYHSGKVFCRDNEDTLWDGTYWLYVREDENIFYHVNENRYYTFEGACK